MLIVAVYLNVDYECHIVRVSILLSLKMTKTVKRSMYISNAFGVVEIAGIGRMLIQ